MSYGPFLGGKRVCLGKTFAEHIVRFQLAIIMSQLDFKFAEPHYYERKPKNHSGMVQPPYPVYVTIRD